MCLHCIVFDDVFLTDYQPSNYDQQEYEDQTFKEQDKT